MFSKSIEKREFSIPWKVTLERVAPFVKSEIKVQIQLSTYSSPSCRIKILRKISIQSTVPELERKRSHWHPVNPGLEHFIQKSMLFQNALIPGRVV